jgi:hypothetical protein
MTILKNLFKNNFKLLISLFPHRETEINNSHKVDARGSVVLILPSREYNNFGIRKFML